MESAKSVNLLVECDITWYKRKDYDTSVHFIFAVCTISPCVLMCWPLDTIYHVIDSVCMVHGWYILDKR